MKGAVLHINANGSNPLYVCLYLKQREIGIDLDIYNFFRTTNLKRVKVIPDEIKDHFFCDVSFSQWHRFFFPLKGSITYKQMLRRMLPTRERYTLTHAHTLFSAGYMAYRLKKEKGIPYIVVVQNTDTDTFFRLTPWYRPLGHRILHEAGAIVFLSPVTRAVFFERYCSSSQKGEYERKSFVIPLGIDDKFHESQSDFEKVRTSKTKVVLEVAEVRSNKNQLSVAKAIQLLRKRGEDIVYRVIGSVVEKDYYQKLMKYPFVEYIAPLPHEQLIEEYRKADLFVMASHHESFGLVYAEALSQNLPILYTKEQGFDGTFKNGAVGFSVDDNSVTDIAEKIKRVLDNPIDVRPYQKTIKEKFSWLNIARHYEDIYEKVIFEARGIQE